MIKNALISVSDKTGIVDFAKSLADLGVTIYSTGGTYKAIHEAGVAVHQVEELTHFPEMMDGRVKTLHPMVHGGILAVRNDEKHVAAMKEHDIQPLDLVVVNLYPFRETIAKPGVELAEAIENIDIGGPTMVRSAAKNNAFVGIVVNPERYDEVIERLKKDGDLGQDFRFALAKEAFAHTAAYDTAIANYFSEQLGQTPFPPEYLQAYEKVTDLRYGENPHQKAAFYKEIGAATGMGAMKQLHGKELSYNNIVDMEAAWNMVWEFEEPAACIIKHTNPCGAATGESLHEAYVKAYEADSVSAFGGIVSLNREVDEATAQEMSKIFLEVIMAPKFSTKALAILEAKKNIRLIELERPALDQVIVKKVSGGLLVQTEDDLVEDVASYTVVTKTQPTEEQWKALKFAWKLVKHVKSNAILIAKDNQTLGVGAGQMNRVGAANIALEEAGEQAKGAVLASDAFFPFGDTVATAAAHGIAAIIQPGGSIRDEESIAEADKAGIAMVFTHVRHFKH
ncbi:MAG: bifunctional phosphoribosylaminoimidazolecarboxamide formyltransferase/IMP cyclohydrolase [Veillonella sp.]|uniref:bifunctional phosphoribosylaminoimidazolecarboxamide formyltransferase/IMP cyclohydrolase n=1 Tax=Veillonella sp. TaxID=1926307 RepID=UPI0025DAE9C6|nr:bifunctional phosphoribosylaminoimidazolecarboxamide formyltransferase/IMP cyclohydrolase [Veillonella sp.]MBS4914300.1 bifunctional phosphoribosylaminoimidazolecarboxamide formyltransferase/IMP cyclohydrolase [Veillonella sp.]